MGDYYIPKYRYEIVKLLEFRYVGSERVGELKRLKKRQLYKILFESRRRDAKRCN